MVRESGLGFSKIERSWEKKKRSIKNYAYHGIMSVSYGLQQIRLNIFFKGYRNLERDTLHSMEEMELRNATINDTQDRMQTAEAKAHHYDATKFDRPSVTVDVVMMSLRQRDLQVLLVKRRSWPYEGMWAIPGVFVKLFCIENWTNGTFAKRFYRRAFWKIRVRRKWRVPIVLPDCIVLTLLQNANCSKVFRLH